jgi:hypothetical protein
MNGLLRNEVVDEKRKEEEGRQETKNKQWMQQTTVCQNEANEENDHLAKFNTIS